MPNVVHHYDTVADMTRAVAEMNSSKAWDHSYEASVSDWNPISFDDTVKHGVEGWEKGRNFMQAVADRIRTGNAFHRLPAFSYDVAGSYPNAALAATGDPFCMVDARPDLQKSRPVLHFMVNLSNSCAWSAEAINNYGGALLSWIDYLDNIGFSIQLDGYMYTVEDGDNEDKPGTTCLVTFGIKTAGQPLNMDALGFALVHSGLTRRLGFKIKGVDPSLSPLGSWLGYPKMLPASKRDADRIWLDGRYHEANKSCRTAEGALREIKRQIRDACKAADIPLDVDDMLDGEPEED